MFALRTLPVPQLGSGEVLIQVKSAGVGASDMCEHEGMCAEIDVIAVVPA